MEVYNLLQDPENSCIRDAIKELRRGHRVYIYKTNILEEVKKQFNNLEIKKKDFYWIVKNNDKILMKRGRKKIA